MRQAHRIAMLAGVASAFGCTGNPVPRFEVSFPATLSAHPITGHVFVSVYTQNDVEPRVAAFQSSRDFVARVPFFAVDVDSLQPGQPAIVDTGASSYPLTGLRSLPAGDYYIVAVDDIVLSRGLDPTLLSALAGLADRLTVVDGQSRSVELTTRSVPRTSAASPVVPQPNRFNR